jgi:uncharacterized protein
LDLKKVPRLGDKAFEQCAGFLRIRDGENLLDTSAVHPETYYIVAQIAQDLKCKVKDLMKDEELRKKIDLKKYVSETVGLPTLQDIIQELAKPGRDPREQFEAVEFAEGINSMEDLRLGMKLNGVVTNITNFGAFVDIGVHQDGLVHISQMSHKRINSPHEVLKLGQKVSVTVTEIDIPRKRIALTMKDDLIESQSKQGEKRTKEYNEVKQMQGKPFENKPQQAKPKKEENEIEGDLQAKLKALKEKFGK